MTRTPHRYGGPGAPTSRRQFLHRTATGLAAGLAGAALPGCASGIVPGGGIRFWNGFTGPDGRAMLRLVDAFNEQADGSVRMQRTDWATYYSKLFVAGLGGRAPEVFVLQAEQLARFVRAGLVSPMDDLYGDAPDQLPVADFDANVLDVVEFDGRRFGMPLDVHPMGTYYNVDLLAKAGYDAPPTQGDAFLECLRAVDASSGGNVFPYVFCWWRLNAFAALWQWGGSVFGEDPTQCVLDSPQAIEGFRWCSDLVREKRLAPSPQAAGDSWVGFRQGRVGVAWHGMFMLADLQRVDDLPWAGAPVAQVGPQPATWGGSHVLCFRPDIEGDTLETALALARYLSAAGLEWAQGGQIPPRKSLRDTDDFRSMQAQSAFAEMLPYTKFMPQVPMVQEYLTAIDYAIEQTLRGAGAENALKTAARSVQQAIDRYLAAGWDPSAPVTEGLA